VGISVVDFDDNDEGDEPFDGMMGGLLLLVTSLFTDGRMSMIAGFIYLPFGVRRSKRGA
jgi:hypothetical protein